MQLGRVMSFEGNEEQIIALILFFLFSVAYFLSIAIDRMT